MSESIKAILEHMKPVVQKAEIFELDLALVGNHIVRMCLEYFDKKCIQGIYFCLLHQESSNMRVVYGRFERTVISLIRQRI